MRLLSKYYAIAVTTITEVMSFAKKMACGQNYPDVKEKVGPLFFYKITKLCDDVLNIIFERIEE